MLDKRKNAIRYLLLRHLWSFRDQVSPSIYQEVTRSLLLKREGESYHVSWARQSKQFFHILHLDQFDLYVRGDLAGSNDQLLEGEALVIGKNASTARDFARLALAFDKERPPRPEASLFPYFQWNVIGYLVISAVLMLLGGLGALPLALAVPALFLPEYWLNRGKIFTLATLLLLTWSFPCAGFLASVAYGFFQFFDPNSSLRRARVALSLATVVVAGLRISALPSNMVFDMDFLGASCLALGLFLIRWTRGAHFRSLPLCFPFLSLGLYLDGDKVGTFALLALGLAGVIAMNWVVQYLPIQRQRLLTPNG